jgi:hypothetical protein
VHSRKNIQDRYTVCHFSIDATIKVRAPRADTQLWQEFRGLELHQSIPEFSVQPTTNGFEKGNI